MAPLMRCAFIDEALDDNEIAALIQSGKDLIKRPHMPAQDFVLKVGNREFSSTLTGEPFLAVRLDRGELKLQADYTGADRIERIELRRLPESNSLHTRFVQFEARVPNLGVHLGLRRDCGSTFSRVGRIQKVTSTEPQEYVFEGAIDDFPSPDVGKG